METTIAAQVGIGALKVTAICSDSSPSDQKYRYYDLRGPARCPGGDWRPALKVTTLPRWGSAPSKLPLFTIIPFQVTISTAICGDPARCPGGDWRPQSYQAAKVGIGHPQSYRYLR